MSLPPGELHTPKAKNKQYVLIHQLALIFPARDAGKIRAAFN